MGTFQAVRARKTYAAAAAALVLATSAACGAGESDSTSSGSTDSSAVERAKATVKKYTAPVTKYHEIPPVKGDVASLAGKEVWYVPLGAAIPGLKAFGEGMADALKNIDVDLHICDGKFVPTAISACLDQAGTSGADAVVTGYVDYNLVPTAVNALSKKGIPVLVAGAPLPEGKSNSPELSFDDTTAVQNLLLEVSASAIIADSDGKAEVLFVGLADSPTVTKVGDHAVDFINKECPGCTVNRVSYSTASLDKLASQVSAALIKAPKTRYIMTQVDPAVTGATAGAQAAGMADKIRIASSGADLASLQDIKAGGKQFANAGYGFSYSGWRWADEIVRMMAGGVPSDVSVTDSAVIRLFTKDNVEDLALTPAAFATNDWFGSDAFKATFLSAWGAE